MRVQRESAPDDELQTMRVQRESAPDDELQTMRVQREGAVEEEEVAPPPAAEAETQEVAPGEADPGALDEEAMLMPEVQRQEDDELAVA
jgi:hypothetical protein